jgi:hypothetical protein
MSKETTLCPECGAYWDCGHLIKSFMALDENPSATGNRLTRADIQAAHLQLRQSGARPLAFDEGLRELANRLAKDFRQGRFLPGL